MEPLRTLLTTIDGGRLPAPFGDLYPAPLFDPSAGPLVYANFVESVDGVVALAEGTSSGSVISGRNEADRFLMGVLRAHADAVLIGAGTLRGSPRHQWTAPYVYPALQTEFAALRKQLGLAPEPRLVVITGSGKIDKAHAGLGGDVTVITTAAGRQELGETPAGWDVIVQHDDSVDIPQAVRGLLHRGYSRILSEAGPNVMSQLIDGGVVDELFLTVSPVLAGASSQTRGLTNGAPFLPVRRVNCRLITIHNHEDHLFLRYRVAGGLDPVPAAFRHVATAEVFPM